MLIGLLGTLIPILFLVITSMFIYGTNFPLLKFYYQQGIFEQRNGNLTKAIKHYDKVIELNNTYTNAYISKGSSYLDLSEYEKAILNFTKAIKIDPNNEEAYAYRGRAFYEIDSLSLSKADFD